MAEKISIQIALEGGAEIEKQLAGIGEAGQKAFADITKSAEQAGGFKQLEPGEVTQKIKDMGVTGVDAIEKIQSAVKQAGRLEGIVQGVQAVEGGFAKIGQAALALAPVIAGIAVAGGAAFFAAAKATISFADAISKVNAEALKLGTGIEKFDQLRLGLEKAGISAQGVTSGLENFQRVFGSLDGLPRFIEQLRQMPASAERSALAIKVFGQVAGTELIQALRTGSIGIDQFTQKQQGLTQEQANAASKLEQSINRMKAAFDRLDSLALSQTLTDSIDLATNAIEKLGGGLDALKGIGTSDIGKGIGEGIAQAVAVANAAVANLVGGIMRGMGASEAAIKAVQDQINGVVPAANAAKQAVQQSSQMFTSWGTRAQQAGQEAADGLTNAGQAVQQAGTMFTSFGTAAGEAGQKGAQGFQQVGSAAQDAGTKIEPLDPMIAGITWDTISSIGVAAWNALTDAIQAAIDKLLVFIGLKPSAPATGGGAPGNASGGLLGGRGTGTSDSNLAWVSRGEFIVQAAAVRKYGASLFAALNAGRFADGGLVGGGGTTTLSIPANEFISALQKNTEAIDSQSTVIIELGRLIDGLIQTVGGLVQTVGGLAQQQSELVKSFNDLMQWAKRTAPQEKARGGLLGGRGSGTSDSNLAWVSRGEHIMPARAVAQPGVLAFLEALRRSGGNLAAVLDGMGRFALGGMVPRAMPAFASGGLAGGMSNVTIQFPGLPAIGGLRASSDVVDQLHKAAALAQVRSGGRKPSRYS